MFLENLVNLRFLEDRSIHVSRKLVDLRFLEDRSIHVSRKLVDLRFLEDRTIYCFVVRTFIVSKLFSGSLAVPDWISQKIDTANILSQRIYPTYCFSERGQLFPWTHSVYCSSEEVSIPFLLRWSVYCSG